MFFPSGEPVPNYLPPRWSTHVHPEGQLYFCKEGPIRIVTEASIHNADILEKVNYWVKEIERLMPDNILRMDAVELFIQIDGNDCYHYLVDHRSCTQFWVETIDSDALGLLPAASPSHMRLTLQELYWLHVEYFPMHHTELPGTVLEELIGVFTHGFADQMTSRNSTFPYTEADCRKLLKLLRGFRGQAWDGYSISIVARLWHLVFNHRFSTHHGEEHARLSRDQVILAYETHESSRVASLTSLLSFRTSDFYVKALNDLYVDHLVYTHQWQPFMKRRVQEWQKQPFMCIVGLLLHVFCYFISTCRAFAVLSAFNFSASILCSLFLIHQHESLQNATAAEALNYLNCVCSAAYKFQWVAFCFSMPKALFHWGVFWSTMNTLVALSILIGGTFWKRYFLGLFGLCLVMSVIFLDVTSSTKILGFHIPCLNQYRQAKEADGSLV